MLAVAPFHRIVRWLELEGTSGGLLDQFPTGGKADFKLGSGCWVRALLGQAVWSLRMEVTQSLWATCRTCSCSTAPSHPVGISFVATCACCLLCFRQMPQGRDWLHLFCNPHWVLFKSFCFLTVLHWEILIWLLVFQKVHVTEYLLWWAVTLFNNCRLSKIN